MNKNLPKVSEGENGRNSGLLFRPRGGKKEEREVKGGGNSKKSLGPVLLENIGITQKDKRAPTRLPGLGTRE